MKNPKSIIRKRREKPGRILVVQDTENTEDVKQKIAEMITAASVQMTESVIRTVNERGSFGFTFPVEHGRIFAEVGHR